MTKAMAPWEHEVSQSVGHAIAAVSANPAAVVPIEYEIALVIFSVRLELMGFDVQCQDMSAAIDKQLADWRTQLDGVDYRVPNTIPDDWNHDEWWVDR